MLLNPDAALGTHSLENLRVHLYHNNQMGIVCPKLLRADKQLEMAYPPTIDAAGIYFTQGLRHFDRGSGELDRGQFDSNSYVFGASGAAMMIRKDCLLDIASTRDYLNPKDMLQCPDWKGEIPFFDSAFFTYREDAETALRAQYLGWECYYVADALVFHQRRVTPDRRKQLSTQINAYGVRNRFLIQANNFWLPVNLFGVLPIWFRNLIVIGALYLSEKSSKPALTSARSLYKRARGLKARLLLKRRRSITELRHRLSPDYNWDDCLAPIPLLPAMSKIQVLIINYNSGDALRECLAALSEEIKSTDLDLVVDVFDNCSSDSSYRDACGKFGDVQNFYFTSSRENLGFAGAINKGARENIDGLLVLNPDVILKEGCIDKLVSTLAGNSKAVVAAPLLYSTGGVLQENYLPKSIPRGYQLIAELLALHRILPKWGLDRGERYLGDKLVAEWIEPRLARKSSLQHRNSTEAKRWK